MKARPSTRRQSHLLERAARPQPLAPNGQISPTKHHISKDLGGIPHHLLISHKGLDRYGAQTRPAPAATGTLLSTRLSIAPLLDPHMPSNHAHPTLSLSHAVMLLRLFFLTRAHVPMAHARHPRPLPAGRHMDLVGGELLGRLALAEERERGKLEAEGAEFRPLERLLRPRVAMGLTKETEHLV